MMSTCLKKKLYFSNSKVQTGWNNKDKNQRDIKIYARLVTQCPSLKMCFSLFKIIIIIQKGWAKVSFCKLLFAGVKTKRKKKPFTCLIDLN